MVRLAGLGCGCRWNEIRRIHFRCSRLDVHRYVGLGVLVEVGLRRSGRPEQAPTGSELAADVGVAARGGDVENGAGGVG